MALAGQEKGRVSGVHDLGALTPDERFRQAYHRLPGWKDNGPDRQERYAAAMASIREAAAAGSLEACGHLASAEEDVEGRWRWALQAAEAGDVRAMSGLVTDDDGPEVGGRVLAAAKAGVAWAQLVLASVYGNGMEDTATGVTVATQDGGYGWLPGVPDPEAEAVRWRDAAIAQGFAPAWLDQAHDQKVEDPEAAYRSVSQALAGELVPRLRKQAEMLAAKLADALDLASPAEVARRRALADGGDGASLSWLGDRLRRGDDGPVDLPGARALYERAVAEADVDGLRELGRMCEEGLGGPVDRDRARALYESAAELGADPFARQRLAEGWGLAWYAEGLEAEEEE